MAGNYNIFTNFVDANHNVLFQDIYQPPTPTSKWFGTTSYTRSITVPSTIVPGTYGIEIGIYNPTSSTFITYPLTPGSGVTSLSGNIYPAGLYIYHTGTLNVSAPAINGSCGASNNTNRISAPTTGLCGTGTASSISGAGPWNWSCAGSNGGTTASCSALLLVNGAAGADNGGKFYTLSATDANLCAAGTVGNFTTTATGWTWSCVGLNGGTTVTASASLSVNGTCGVSNNTNRTSTPTTGLCNTGSASTVAGTGPWNWSCTGTNGGTTTSCSALLLVNGAAGADNGGKFYTLSATDANLCAAGTVGNFTTTATGWTWSCVGLNGGTTVVASANLSVKGSCGASNGSNLISAPTTGLCSIGTASSISGNGPWTWNCAGVNGGTSASCSALLEVNGSCGVSNGANLANVPSSGLCSAGTASSITGTGPWTWNCTGSNGGATAQCSAQLIINGACGSSNGANLTNAPTTGLCSTGTSTSITGTGPWNWSCTGTNGGTTTSCSARLLVNGASGADNGGKFYTLSATDANLCATGIVGNFTTIATGWTWSCIGSNGGTTVTASASLSVNGTCGVSNNTNLTSAPTTGLCGAGTASSITGTGPWTWSCAGTSGGTNASCSALLLTNGACGASNGATFKSAPTGGLCSAGTASALSGSGPWAWGCAGSNGGTAASCQALLSMPTILQNSPSPISAISGSSFDITYNWQAVPMAGNYDVFANFVDANHNVLFQDVYEPPVQTSSWSGTVSYSRTLTVPSTLAAGTYHIEIGVFDPNASSFTTFPLTTGAGVLSLSGNVYAAGLYIYQMGTLNVSAPAAVNGACGAANGTDLISAPTTSLCSMGTASSISGTGPWNWSCAGTNGGSTAQCSANIQEYDGLTIQSFIQSVGVNTALSYPGTPYYGQPQNVISALHYLGLNTIRELTPTTGDSADPTALSTQSAVAAAGIRFNCIIPGNGPVNLTADIANLNAFEQAYPGAIVSIEGPNEINGWPITYNGITDDMAAGVAVTHDLWSMVKSSAYLSSSSVYGLTLSDGFTDIYSDETALGNLSAYVNFGAGHIYPSSGYNLWKADMPYWLPVELTPWQTKPMVITETGYETDATAGTSQVNEAVAAKYMLNLLLHNSLAGVAKTFIYGLVDAAPNDPQRYGLFNTDWSPKLGATAIHNMTAILNLAGAGSPLGTLDYTLNDLPPSGYSLLLGGDNAFALAVWNEVTIWNAATAQPINATASTVTVSLGATYARVAIYDPIIGTAPIAMYSNVDTVQISITDHPLIVEVAR